MRLSRQLQDWKLPFTTRFDRKPDNEETSTYLLHLSLRIQTCGAILLPLISGLAYLDRYWDLALRISRSFQMNLQPCNCPILVSNLIFHLFASFLKLTYFPLRPHCDSSKIATVGIVTVFITITTKTLKLDKTSSTRTCPSSILAARRRHRSKSLHLRSIARLDAQNPRSIRTFPHCEVVCQGK